MDSTYLYYLKDKPIEYERFLTLRRTLKDLKPFIAGKNILDFGASSGLSACAYLEAGALTVVGIEPDPNRVERGRTIIDKLGFSERITLMHTSSTDNLPFKCETFKVVFANAVLEHIPQPRAAYVREMWRVLAAGGFLIINETPSKYLPIDLHTTGGLWWVPWLPKGFARRYAIWRGRFKADSDWDHSGWRGVGYYEIADALESPYCFIPETSHWRHRLLTKIGLPSGLLDPYPLLIFKKQ
jgi:ubiquinone/menaquinone biosynthesis C-methylase UbiE